LNANQRTSAKMPFEGWQGLNLAKIPTCRNCFEYNFLNWRIHNTW